MQFFFYMKILHKEILITENGIATMDDNRRQEFITRAMHGIADCVRDGIPVSGYMYWSLLDNYEWQSGYDMHFGLIAVDRENMSRHPKDSLKLLGSFAGTFQ